MIDMPAAQQAQPIRQIVIAGGGTAGWMAACYFAGRLARQGVGITVVESSAIGTVGVGEATVPGIRDYFRAIGVSEIDVLRATGGTVKLGIEFQDWAHPGHRFFHPFGLYGMPSRGVPFHQYWLKLHHAGQGHDLGEYSLCTQMAARGAFMLPPEKPVNDLAVFDWAVHFDASRFAAMLRARAVAQGVRHIDDVIVDVALDGESGHIAHLVTQDHGTIDGDLFIDCTGFRSLLLGKALGVEWNDWTHLLPCDRAVAIPCAADTSRDWPYTVSTAREAGWQWRIPLQHRVGNGYVYSSAMLSDDEATAKLLSRLEGETLAEPNLIRFGAGHRARFWAGNCVAMGLAAGFLEPLESTSITLIQTAIERLADFFPDAHFDPALADEFNRATRLEYARIRDFLILHYLGNRRLGEPFWDRLRDAEVPEMLAHKLRLFRARGRLVRYEWESFLDPSWLSMYAGFDWLPATHDPMADHFTDEEIAQALRRMRETVASAAASARPHRDFIAHIAAGEPVSPIAA
ncbi:tryptophan halogenase family protein [Novosphingobium sp. SG720]|uniref:tryptophan halogenase family protein n=1 Tax=Novosphingobium sp. SG720 TaxID=2586998 RepID=UPI00183C04A5|nr:tryptophan halogenase family protein [Novosphingobium sp. SG720]NKJ42085.1 tryptophan halogenase [Novosphingobium sp. SG720]